MTKPAPSVRILFLFRKAMGLPRKRILTEGLISSKNAKNYKKCLGWVRSMREGGREARGKVRINHGQNRRETHKMYTRRTHGYRPSDAVWGRCRTSNPIAKKMLDNLRFCSWREKRKARWEEGLKGMRRGKRWRFCEAIDR